jgi:hypothetical protein
VEITQIRKHDHVPNLWWVSSSSGDDIAYIVHLGENYLAWTTDKWKLRHASFVGKPFDTVEEAFHAVTHEIIS